MEVALNATAGESLEHYRPRGDVEWLLVASGYWSQDVYHGGYIAYYLAKTAPDEWVMDSAESDPESEQAGLDDVEVGDNGCFQRIVAACRGAPLDARPEDVAAELYRLICKAGGSEIDEPDDLDGLINL